MRIAINGFGRIGRNFLRALLEDHEANKKIHVAAINIGCADINAVAHMFKYDTLLGTYPGTVTVAKHELHVGKHRIKLISELDAERLPWKKLSIDWVVDASGKFTTRDCAKLHLKAGAKKVLITAPAQGDDVTIIPGVNMHDFNAKKHHIVSLGSCTTNAFIPMLKVLHDAFVIQKGCMTTIHAYTNSQVLLDVEAKDLRISRAAALNIIPTTTGAMKMVGKLMPDLAGAIDAKSIRVPVGKVSLIDLVVLTKKKMTTKTVNNAFAHAARSAAMKGIVAVTSEPLVSSDFSGNNASVTIDSLLTHADGSMAKVFGWYDNEWAYSVRLKDFLLNV